MLLRYLREVELYTVQFSVNVLLSIMLSRESGNSVGYSADTACNIDSLELLDISVANEK